MKLLIDNALSPTVAESLRKAGHDAVHVRELGMGAAPDEEIFQHASTSSQVLVSSDTDFGGLLRLSQSVFPSLILLRGGIERRPRRQVELLVANLGPLAESLEKGAVAVLEPGRIRVRRLPL